MDNLSIGIKCFIFVITFLLQNNELINKFKVNLTQFGVHYIKLHRFTLLATYELSDGRLKVLEYYHYLSSFLFLVSSPV